MYPINYMYPIMRLPCKKIEKNTCLKLYIITKSITIIH
ncbi:hypothetical protein m4_igs_459 [Acanthamoeba polyphaga mimivirus]|nr:hypothetical protein m4_igs_459 [Acanthamoeba polyphaga mimivirus]